MSKSYEYMHCHSDIFIPIYICLLSQICFTDHIKTHYIALADYLTHTRVYISVGTNQY